MTSTATTTITLSDLTGTWTLDPSHTRVGFVARHALVTKVRGSFNEFDGTATIDGSDLTKSSVQLNIKVDSIDTRDANRDGHRRSGPLRPIARYPESALPSPPPRPPWARCWSTPGGTRRARTCRATPGSTAAAGIFAR